MTTAVRSGCTFQVCTSIIALALLHPSLGAAGSNSEQTSGDSRLQEVIVTAQKREERLQDVPAAVSALTGVSLAAMGAESFTDYARSIPGLTFTDQGVGRQTPIIRGINPAGGNGATVGYYIGETPFAAAPFVGTNNPMLIDIDRIEVLRGPQGTLYGSSSMGGTIKLVPNAPNLSQVEGLVKGKALVTQGEDGPSPGAQAELVLNLPIVQGTAALRTAFWYRNDGGFINRTWSNAGELGIATPPPVGKVANLPDEHTWGLRATALFQPTEQLSLSAMVYLQHQHFDGFQDITGGASNPNDRLVQTLISDVPETQENEFALYSFTLKYGFDRFNLVSSTSYSDARTVITEEGISAIQLFPTFLVPAPPPVTAAFPNPDKAPFPSYNFTQEVRLATTQSIVGFDGLVGWFYRNGHSIDGTAWSGAPQYNELVAGNDPANRLYAPGNNLVTSNRVPGLSWGPGARSKEHSVFGELTYHLTDSLSLTGGLRRYDLSQDGSNCITGWFIGGNTPGVNYCFNLPSTINGFIYKGDLSYKLTPDHLLYAQFSEGYRPGSTNLALPPVCNLTSSDLEVQSDSIKNYEVGAKTTWLERRLTVNAAVYRMDWSKIQQFILLPCGFGIQTNAGEAIVKGAELESSAQLTDRLSVGLSATYLQAKLQQGNPAVGALAGDQIESVPNWQYALYVNTTFPLLAANDGFARLDYQYTGSSFGTYTRLSDGSRDPASESQVVHLLNLRAGMQHHAWEFALSGTNLLNRTVRQSLDPYAFVTLAIPGRPRLVVTRPRTFSASVSYQF